MSAQIEITQGGDRAVCPFCEKLYAVPPSVHSIGTQGLWAHIKAKHGNEDRTGMYEDWKLHVARAANLRRKLEKQQETERKDRDASEKREAREAPLRKHTITGGFLMDIRNELASALDMMEPYYSQCNAGEDGYAMVAKLEEIIGSKS